MTAGKMVSDVRFVAIVDVVICITLSRLRWLNAVICQNTVKSENFRKPNALSIYKVAK